MKTFMLSAISLGLLQVALHAQAPDTANLSANAGVPSNGNATFTGDGSGGGPLPYRWLFNNNPNGPANIITTVAGGGWGRGNDGLGDGGAAVNASLSNPCGIALDGRGNLFISDCLNNLIRKVNAHGIITVFAGGGTGGGNDGLGDGGAATNAILNWPNTIIPDAVGDLLFDDYNNNRVRKISADGIITTIVGGGTGGLGDGGAATDASLNNPACIARDRDGNLLVADAHNNRIRKVDRNGIITTIAGGGAGGGTDGLGDGGPATNAIINYAGGLAVDAFGNIYIVDTFNHRVRKVDREGIITTFAGGGAGGGTDGLGDGGPASNAILAFPNRVTVDPAGNLLIADFNNNRIRNVDTHGIIATVIGGGTGGGTDGLGDGDPAANAILSAPLDMVFDSSGNLFIADDHNNRIRKVTFYFNHPPAQALNNIATRGAGWNQGTASASQGNITSNSNAISLDLSPTNLRASAVAGGMQVQFSGKPGYPYILEWSANLTSPWLPIFTNDPDSNGNWSWVDPNASAHPGGYYRAAAK
jgi:hypothetical protein